MPLTPAQLGAPGIRLRSFSPDNHHRPWLLRCTRTAAHHTSLRRRMPRNRRFRYAVRPLENARAVRARRNVTWAGRLRNLVRDARSNSGLCWDDHCVVRFVPRRGVRARLDRWKRRRRCETRRRHRYDHWTRQPRRVSSSVRRRQTAADVSMQIRILVHLSRTGQSPIPPRTCYEHQLPCCRVSASRVLTLVVISFDGLPRHH